MLAHVVMPQDSIIIIESDNCAGKYKFSQHFFDVQQIANTYDKTVIRVFGISGHGKGEVDHVIPFVFTKKEKAKPERYVETDPMAYVPN